MAGGTSDASHHRRPRETRENCYLLPSHSNLRTSESTRAEGPPRRLGRNLGAHALRTRRALEHLEAPIGLDAHGPQLGKHFLDPYFVLQIHVKVDIGFRPVLRRLSIL